MHRSRRISARGTVALGVALTAGSGAWAQQADSGGSAGALQEVVNEIAGTGGNAKAFALDVASEESIKSCAKSALQR